MPDLRQTANLSLIFVCLVATAYVTRMVLSYVWQRFRFLYGQKPKPPVTPTTPPPVSATTDTQNSDTPQ
jgi:hypothetical protein